MHMNSFNDMPYMQVALDYLMNTMCIYMVYGEKTKV